VRTEAVSAHLATAVDLLAGSTVVHDVVVPADVLTPTVARDAALDAPPETIVRVRALSVGTLILVSKATRDDPSLVPLLIVKEALVEPALSIDQIRQLHVGLLHFLVGAINEVSGLTADGDTVDAALGVPLGSAHVLLARHFGWTPEQVAGLTPGQVAIYLAGVDRLLEYDKAADGAAAAGPADDAARRPGW
jgi:hypothetical protein